MLVSLLLLSSVVVVSSQPKTSIHLPHSLLVLEFPDFRELGCLPCVRVCVQDANSTQNRGGAVLFFLIGVLPFHKPYY